MRFLAKPHVVLACESQKESSEPHSASRTQVPRELRQKRIRSEGLERWRIARGRSVEGESRKRNVSDIPEEWLKAIGIDSTRDFRKGIAIEESEEYRRNSEIHNTAALGRKLVLDSLLASGMEEESLEVQTLPEGSPANFCYRVWDELTKEHCHDRWYGLSVRTTKRMQKKQGRKDLVACFTIGRSFCDLHPLNRQIMVFVALEENRMWAIPSTKIQGMKFLEIVDGGKWSHTEISSLDLADHIAEITLLLDDCLWWQSTKQWRKITSITASKGIQNSDALNHFLELLLSKCDMEADFNHVISIKGYTYNVEARLHDRLIRIQDVTASRVKSQHGLLVSLRKNGGKFEKGHRRTLKPFEEDDFDLLRVSLPDSVIDCDSEQVHPRLAFMYLIPATALLERGILSSKSSKGKVSLRLYPNGDHNRTHGPAPDMWANEYLVQTAEGCTAEGDCAPRMVEKVRRILLSAC